MSKSKQQPTPPPPSPQPETPKAHPEPMSSRSNGLGRLYDWATVALVVTAVLYALYPSFLRGWVKTATGLQVDSWSAATLFWVLLIVFGSRRVISWLSDIENVLGWPLALASVAVVVAGLVYSGGLFTRLAEYLSKYGAPLLLVVAGIVGLLYSQWWRSRKKSK